MYRNLSNTDDRSVYFTIKYPIALSKIYEEIQRKVYCTNANWYVGGY